MKVKAAVARVHRAPLAIEGLELDEPRADEVLVRLVACGVARADLKAIEGELLMPLPFVPGTEGAGIVEKVGDAVTHVATGDAVIISAASCGACAPCVAGRPRACTQFSALNLAGRRLDGSTPFLIEEAEDAARPHEQVEVNGFFFGQSSFATHALCRAASIIKLPVGAPLEILAGFGCELLIGAGVITHGFCFEAEDTLVVTGADAIGLVAIMVAKARGAGTIFVAEADEARGALATEIGATVVVQDSTDLASAVRSMTGAGARFALDTTGEDAARKACLDSLAEGGTCALVDPPAAAAVGFDDRVTGDATRVISADGHADPKVLIPELVALQAQGRLPIDKLLSFFPFELVNDALEAFAQGKVVKPVLRFPLGSFGDLDRAETEGAASAVPDEVPEPDGEKVTDPQPVEEDEKDRVPSA